MNKDTIREINTALWDEKGSDVIGVTALPALGAFVSEENHHLFGDVSGKKVLEIGCGRGHSLQYLGERKAAELWGIDISEKQIEQTRKHLAECGLFAKLICSPMEEECGIPADYFDIVYAIYAIGWTTDLDVTFSRIASYLKKGGALIFSWSHQIHKCVVAKNDTYVFQKSYFDESWYSDSIGGEVFALSNRMLSTYVNALARAGFFIEQMIEKPDEEILRSCKENDEYVKRARMVPKVFVIKARKLYL
ncbi:MAG: class I SAM-dependent methyltransferase [Oscillospiraceae bacterium]|nr:class I SAM-dependent methyltransferase [Oscillospiraceae bacterium]